jgi:hypothetical protein
VGEVVGEKHVTMVAPTSNKKKITTPTWILPIAAEAAAAEAAF